MGFSPAVTASLIGVGGGVANTLLQPNQQMPTQMTQPQGQGGNPMAQQQLLAAQAQQQQQSQAMPQIPQAMAQLPPEILMLLFGGGQR